MQNTSTKSLLFNLFFPLPLLIQTAVREVNFKAEDHNKYYFALSLCRFNFATRCKGWLSDPKEHGDSFFISHITDSTAGVNNHTTFDSLQRMFWSIANRVLASKHLLILHVFQCEVNFTNVWQIILLYTSNLLYQYGLNSAVGHMLYMQKFPGSVRRFSSHTLQHFEAKVRDAIFPNAIFPFFYCESLAANSVAVISCDFVLWFLRKSSFFKI